MLIYGVVVCLLGVACILAISSVAAASSSTLVIVWVTSLASAIVFIVVPLPTITLMLQLLLCWWDLDGGRWGMSAWNHAICHLWGIVSILWLCWGGPISSTASLLSNSFTFPWACVDLSEYCKMLSAKDYMSSSIALYASLVPYPSWPMVVPTFLGSIFVLVNKMGFEFHPLLADGPVLEVPPFGGVFI